MSNKVNVTYIDFGTGSRQVADDALPSVFSPSSYTPDQVGSEGTNKVSAHLKGIDNYFQSLGANFNDQFFDGDNATEIWNPEGMLSSSIVDVSINGRLGEEDEDWERDVGGTGIRLIDEAGDPVNTPLNTRLRVRIYISDAFLDEFFDGGTDAFTLVGDVTKKIDVYTNGILKEDGASLDYLKNAGGNQVVFNYTVDSSARVRVRVYS